jgi:ADP-heptose:LPS heptosyltransferase
MYRERKQVISHTQHNFVLNHAALGDMISSLPAIVWARKFYGPRMKLRVWVPTWQMELVAHLLAPYGEIEVGDLMKLPLKHLDRAKQFEGEPFSYNAAVLDQHTRCRVHMVDYAFNYLLNSRPETMDDRSYPTKAPLAPARVLPGGLVAGGYVVFPVGATSDNKLFRASVMGPVMKWCQDNAYEAVITGTKTSHTHTKVEGELRPVVLREQSDMLPREIFERLIDLREQTTLLNLRDVLGHAAAVVGVDGGTLHLAGTTDVPIVFASGTTLPKHRYIPRHGSHTFRARYIGPRDLECYGCQSNWPMTVLHFTKCVYDDNACMEQLHPDDFINGLKELGL